MDNECELICKKCEDSATCEYVMMSSDYALGKSSGWEICDVSLEYTMDIGKLFETLFVMQLFPNL